MLSESSKLEILQTGSFLGVLKVVCDDLQRELTPGDKIRKLESKKSGGIVFDADTLISVSAGGCSPLIGLLLDWTSRDYRVSCAALFCTNQ